VGEERAAVTQDDNGEEVAREVQPEERRPTVRVPVDGGVHRV
jgi:hypothetical protein